MVYYRGFQKYYHPFKARFDSRCQCGRLIRENDVVQYREGRIICPVCVETAKGYVGQIPAGWYPDPEGITRYWNGFQWTEETK